jgi:SPX domain protein involved in polyphosphate accumulation
MAASAELYRYERKFLVNARTGSSTEMGIKLNPAIFSPLFNPRTVNNIYLDSPALHHYFMNLHGATARTKVRIRWYGDLLGPLPSPVLEFKTKKGLLGQKKAFPLKSFCLDQTFDGKSLRMSLQSSSLPEEVHHLLADLQPTLVNSYSRKYYQSANRKYRLTQDSKLRFLRVRPGHNTWLCQAPHCDLEVVELKYDQIHADGADEIAAALPFRMTRMSKYVFGVESLDGY